MRGRFSLLASGLALLSAGQAAANPARAPHGREAYFGETHVHTSWSLDAYLFGNHLTGPADAYKYFTGETIKHPLGYDIKITTPLDWAGVTDHSEYVGVMKEANTPGSAVSKLPAAKPLIVKDWNDKAEVQKVFLYLLKLMAGTPVAALMSPSVAQSIWKKNVDIADQYNKPGKFTAFCSYEFTSTHDYRNLHRNIFFRDCAKVPDMPFSSLQSWHPEDLWKWMDGQRKAGNELLAISHNANLSDGWMYPTDVDSLGRPIDAAWADARDRNERLVEIKQIKGQSETHPLLSPNDEYASFEINSYLLGLPAESGRVPHIVGSYTRQALKDGLSMQDNRGYNPYKPGIVGGSDSHNTGVPYRQDNFYGAHGINDGAVETRMSGHLFSGVDARLIGPSGLTGVWAEENTRAAIWDAMHRKETFGTSGPRIKVRFFGGWEYGRDVIGKPDWVKTGYDKGVAMGADLPPQKAKAPTFLVWAVKDPTSGNLDRIQIVKGWTKSGQSFEKIFDVVWAGNRKPDKWTGKVPSIGSTVDVDNATYTNSIGAVELKTVWSDPEFDPGLHAFYYVRVLEIPTPRWTTIQAHQLGIAPPDVVAPTVQERAWSSPIWYTPSAEARKNVPSGLTVAELRKKGAVPLNDAQLKTLVVGKGMWWRNTVTGEPFKLRCDTDGRSVVLHIRKGAGAPSEMGNTAESAYLVEPSPYAIKNGKLVTWVGNTPIELSIYKLGSTYYAARANEFGHANYEMLPKGPANMLDLKKGESPESPPPGYQD